MMRLVIPALAVLALAGCQSVEQLRAAAPQQNDFTICKAMVTGNQQLQQVAWEEKQRRGLDCGPYMAAIAQSQQADAQRAAVGLQLMQMSRPQPMPMPQIAPSVSCISRPSMGTVYTTCN